jgi:hypothetical protein
VSDSEEIYRKAALDQYLAAHEFGSVTRVSPPWTWAILLISLAAVGGAVLFSIVTRIEVTDRVPGIVAASGRVVSHVNVAPENGDVVHLEIAGRTERGRIVAIERVAINREPASNLYRVEITVANPLGVGTPVNVRIVRRDRPIFIFFAPLRRWLNG